MQTLTITRLGHQGDGIADGPVYVPRTLPGEVVRWDGISAKIDTPSEARVSPVCRHAKSCGGCMLQHASDGFVAEWKRDVVQAALLARGLEWPLRDVHTSPPKSRRRATFSGRRTKSGAQIGFHALRSELLMPVTACEVITPALANALPHLEPLVVATASRKGEVKLVLTETDSGIDLDVRGGKPLDPLQISTLRFDGLARLSQDGEPLATWTVPRVRMGEAQVALPPGAFLQATREGEAALLSGVLEAVAGASQVADLFAGGGTFSLPLSAKAKVFAVEGAEELTSALAQAARDLPGHHISTETRDLFRRPVPAAHLADCDAVVIDPPRAGAEAQMREVALARPAQVAMVSCNPVTFARDATFLAEAGYVCRFIDVVDQFRWSPHVEVVAGFALP